MNSLIRLILIGFGGLGAAMPVHAQTESEPMLISATVFDGCRVSATTMSFGVIAGIAGAATANSQITLLCNPNIDYEISLDAGQHTQGARNRRMQNSVDGSFLRYDIYRDAARSQPWDTRNNRTVTGNSGTAGTAIQHTAYGEIPRVRGLASSGVYSDTVTVTVTF